MTEAEWNESVDKRPMLEFLRGGGMITDRQARLFSVASLRRAWEKLDDPRLREAVAFVERIADGEAGEVERAEFERATGEIAERLWEEHWNSSGKSRYTEFAAQAVHDACSDRPTEMAEVVAWNAAATLGLFKELEDQCVILRDIIDSPFRRVVFDESWKTHPVIRLAEEAYRNPSTEILRVLGDALEEAGVQDPLILGHCRGGHGHARGCWLLDGVLGKS
jgi:hypothetical protein